MRTQGLLACALVAGLLAWSAAAGAEPLPAESDEVVDMLASTIDDQRPLGSPPLVVVYLLLAALGVRIAIRKPAKAPHPHRES